MEHADLEILSNAKRWLDGGEDVTLVTVMKTWGAAPRPAGSIMAISSHGKFSGSVSGGCIEEDILERLSSTEGTRATPIVLQYGGDKEQQRRFQLPCGGTVELLLESLHNPATLGQILDTIAAGQCVVREVNIKTGEVQLQNTHTTQITEQHENTLRRTFGPQWKLLLIGAGELSHCVADMAIPLGYQVTVCDPREEYANNWNLAGVTLTRGMPDDVAIAMGLDNRCAVVTLTHDPKLDDLALLEALTSEAFYIGALGSQRTNAERRNRLKFLGITGAQLHQLKGPVGLRIGSRTPAEIAISILAEMISVRNHVD